MTIISILSVLLLCILSFNVSAQKIYKQEWIKIDSLEKKGLYRMALKEVDLILAEDTRTSGKLLKYFDIDTPMQSHHMHNEHKMVARIVARRSQTAGRSLRFWAWSRNQRSNCLAEP